MDKQIIKDLQPLRLFQVHQQRRSIKGIFNPRTTLYKPSHFPSPFELARKKEYLFITRISYYQFGCRVTYSEGNSSVLFKLYFPENDNPPRDLRIIEDELARRLGLMIDIDGFEKILENDDILASLPKEMRGARPASPFSLYEFLIICNILQNTTVRRTVQMANALAHAIGTPYQFPDGTILYGFWEPKKLIDFGETRLRNLRLGYRAKSLIRFSQQFYAQPDLENDLLELSFNLGQLRSHLKEIYGVGPASAAYVMFEWFKCIDEFTYVSPWERKILSNILFNKEDTLAQDIIEFCRNRWAPWTMLAVHAVFENIFWQRVQGQGPEWLNDLIRP